MQKKLFSLLAITLLCFTTSESKSSRSRRQTQDIKKNKPLEKVSVADMPPVTLTFSQAKKFEELPTPAPLPKPTVSPASISTLLSSLEFSPHGIQLYFDHTFNKREYSKELLPHSLQHITQFLNYGYKTQKPLEFTEGILRLFNQKLKSAPYISAAAFESFATHSSPFLEYYLTKKSTSVWNDFKSIMWDTFNRQFSFLQRSPDSFFEELSKQLERHVESTVTNPERARYTLINFYNASLSKLIWSPLDQEYTWHTFKKIGDHLHGLYTKNVITDELDINDLYWSLVERYCFFLELAGHKLSLRTCSLIKQDLAHATLPWLLHKEQEAHIQTKAERLFATLLETESKIRLHNLEVKQA